MREKKRILTSTAAAKRSHWQKAEIAPLIDQLVSIRNSMLELESRSETYLQGIPANLQLSARNLLHYMSLRRHDIRELQEQLAIRGMSSLGRCEASVMANVEAVLSILKEAATGVLEQVSIPSGFESVDFERGQVLLQENTRRLFHDSGESEPLIMVTMPSEAALDYDLVRELLGSGMRVMRINCAHDDQQVWTAMIRNLRRAEAETGRSCCIAMDLAGPKIRTGPLEPGPRVVSWKPHRDDFGRVLVPARIWFSRDASLNAPVECDLVVSVKGDWWDAVAVGDRLSFTDSAQRVRHVEVMQKNELGFLAEATKTAHVTSSTVFAISSKDHHDTGSESSGGLCDIQPKSSCVRLQTGERLWITAPTILGRSAQPDPEKAVTMPATIGCTLPEIFQNVRNGDRILLDDGKIAGVVIEASPSKLIAEITRVRPGGARLLADKGINFPDTDLQLPALTEKDVEDLEFIIKHADIVNYSFVRRPEDIRLLRDQLQRLGRPDLAIILKIENRQAFDNLPRLLLEVMKCSSGIGVMIARGDLAVECGWERLVELQEEILWLCEAAHLPVVWATQVLDGLAKNGLPTRAEITDAGMGARAECVMLNKGPNIVETVRTLRDILQRMQEHQVKKRSTFRRLKMVEHFFDPEIALSMPLDGL